MTQEEREQLLKDTLLYFSRHNRYVTDENGNKYYREDVTLKAMELSETPLLPAKGVTVEEFLKGCKHDGSYIPVSEVIRLMNEFAAQQQPTAEGAEEILAKGKVLMFGHVIVDPIMLPEGIYATKELRIYLPETTIEHLLETGKSFRDKTQTRWLPDSYFDNLSKCELIDVDVVRDATLHAQKIADKMVEEMLREELMTYDKFLSNTYWGISHITKREEAVDEYLKSRER